MEEDKKRPTASHDHGYDAMPDRRGELRIRTVCRTARVKWATDIGLWRVQNISNKGMRLGTDIALTIGLPIEIALRSAERRIGKECVSSCRSRGSPSH